MILTRRYSDDVRGKHLDGRHTRRCSSISQLAVEVVTCRPSRSVLHQNQSMIFSRRHVQHIGRKDFNRVLLIHASSITKLSIVISSRAPQSTIGRYNEIRVPSGLNRCHCRHRIGCERNRGRTRHATIVADAQVETLRRSITNFNHH